MDYYIQWAEVHEGRCMRDKIGSHVDGNEGTCERMCLIGFRQKSAKKSAVQMQMSDYVCLYNVRPS